MIDASQQDTVASVIIPLARYPHLHAGASLREAILLIHEGMAKPEHSGFRRALVLGEDNVLVGIITLPDLLRGLEPDVLRAEPAGAFTGYVAQPGPESGMAEEVFWERTLSEGFGHEPERPVGELVQPVSVTVAPGDTLARALHLMLTEKQLMLPVVADNRVLGAVRMIEIFERVVAALEKTRKP